MTDKQPKALYFAAMLEVSDKHPELINVNNRAAAELRRLHEESQVSYMNGYESAKGEYRPKLQALEDINAELLEALIDITNECTDGFKPHDLFVKQALAVIAKATGEQQ